MARTAEMEILALERERLNHWARGELGAYAENSSEDVSYFDDIGAHNRIDGRAALLEYFAALEGNVPAHDYELTNPRVQLHGDVGIVTLQYQPTLNGEHLPPWKATSVYCRNEGGWVMVHAHWSMVKGN